MTMRPLFISAKDAKLGADGHRGLWFEKFCDQWEKDDRRGTLKPRKAEWLSKVSSPSVGERGQLEEATLRLARLVMGMGGEYAVLQTESRFVTGLGRAHPVENGFAWHPTLGTPYLPGSSIKGLVRSWAEAETEGSPEIGRLLGTATDEGNAGAVCFLDAIPIKPVCVEIDVLTPHYAGWETGPAEKHPGDWRSPNPVPFLVTAAKQHFLFGLIPCLSRAAKVTAEDLALVRTWLRDALMWEGGGAKTAVGYGRFVEDAAETAKLRGVFEREEKARARAQAMSTPEGRWRLLVAEMSESDLLEAVRVNLEKNELTDPGERRAFLSALIGLRSEWLKQWRRGNKANPQETKLGKPKLKLRAATLDACLQDAGLAEAPAK